MGTACTGGDVTQGMVDKGVPLRSISKTPSRSAFSAVDTGFNAFSRRVRSGPRVSVYGMGMLGPPRAGGGPERAGA